MLTAEMRALFRLRDARLYLLGQACSYLGDSALWLAAGVWIKSLTGSSAQAALVMFCVLVPQAAAPLAGVLVDRVRRRPLLIVVNLGSAALLLLLLLVRDAADIWLIYLVLFGTGVTYALLSSAQSALEVTLVPRHLLGAANSVLVAARDSARIVAPIAGAALFAWGGGALVAVLDAVTFVVAAAMLLALRVREDPPERSAARWRDEVTAGARHIAAVPALRQVVGAGLLVVLVLGFMEAANFALVEDALHRPPEFLGVLGTVLGGGSVAGGLVAPWLLRRTGPGLLTATGMAASATGALVMQAGAGPVILAGLAVRGVGLPLILVGVYTLLQQQTPAQLQGRVAAAASTLLAVPLSAGLGLGALLVETTGYRPLLAAVTGSGFAGALYLVTRPEQRPARATVTAPAGD